MGRYFHPDTDFYRKVLNLTPPDAVAHITEDELAQNMKQLKPNSWTLKGNQLEGMTDMGRLVQTIPTDYILEGTDDEGLPVFRKVVL